MKQIFGILAANSRLSVGARTACTNKFCIWSFQIPIFSVDMYFTVILLLPWVRTLQSVLSSQLVLICSGRKCLDS